MTQLERSIVATLAYFDVFEYPLTSVEIWKWLHREPGEQSDEEAISLERVVGALKESPTLMEKIEHKDGFYVLRGRVHYLVTRQQRYRLAERKWARAVKFARAARLVPFVRMIAVCNSLGYSNARRSSDIDFFVMTSRGRIWTVRLLMVWIMKVLRLRPRRGHMQDTLCLSFFVSEVHGDLSDVTLRETRDVATATQNDEAQRPVPDDIYFTYWLTQMVPLYDESHYYEQLWAANQWIKQSLPNSLPKIPSVRRRVSPRFAASFITASVEWLLGGPVGDFIERSARTFEKAIMPDTLKRLSEVQDTRVVINDQVLKMHNNDRRQLYGDMWHERLREALR